MYKTRVLYLIFFLNIALTGVYAGDLTGKITGTDKKPLKFVRVTLNEPGITVYSDETGKYLVKDIPAGHYNVTFSRYGFETKTFELEINGKAYVLDAVLSESLIETTTIDVTSSFEDQDISQSTFSVSTMNLRTLVRERSHNLGSTIENLPGVNSISTGIGIGKPVIRGLTSNSVLIVHDGVKQESQQWGDEHAPEISLFDLDRIEILRGPSSLVYGSEGIGGVVNIISKPLQFSGNRENIYYGNADLGFFSVNNEKSGNIMLGTGFGNAGFKGHLGFRKSGNVRTPEGTFPVNSLNPSVKDTINGGVLSNSGTEEYEGGLTAGYRGNFGYINAGYEFFNREIQMHDIDPLAEGNQKINTSQFGIEGNFRINKKFHLEPVLSYQMQKRKEFETTFDRETDKAELYWNLKTFQGDIRLHNDIEENLNGTFGVSATLMSNQSLGAEKLIPGYNSAGMGLYAFEKYNFEKFTISAGLRYDYKSTDIEYTIMKTDTSGNVVRDIVPRNINFDAFSGSAGFVFRPNESIDIFSNIGRGWRPPSEYEMYVDGVHEGTNRFERGILTRNPDAEPVNESSLNIDIGVRARLSNFSAEVSLYNNSVYNFIYPSPSGTVDSASGYYIYDIHQDKSTFRGIEYSVQYQPLDFMLLTLDGDYIFSENNATGNPLPFTPPMKNIAGLKLQKQNIGVLYNPYIEFKAKFVSAQNDVDPLETKTGGYALFNIGLGADFVFNKTVASVDLSADNIFDTKYVDHLSRYKTFALNPGRSVNLKVTVPFMF
jgi:iron complex outermembrane recepter protein